MVNKPQSKSVKVRRQLPASSLALMAIVLCLLPEGRDGCMFDRSMKDMDKLVELLGQKPSGTLGLSDFMTPVNYLLTISIDSRRSMSS